MVNMTLIIFFVFYFLLYGPQVIHGTSNIYCWLPAISAKTKAIKEECKGIHAQWLVPPPSTVQAGNPFSVEYQLQLNSSFYSWAVAHKNVFSGNAGFQIGHEVQSKCENKTLDTTCTLIGAEESQCCFHHVDVYSCQASDLSSGAVCDPWYSHILTNSDSLAGSVGKVNWTSEVKGLHNSGEMVLMAHFILDQLHIGLEGRTTVLPVCGDGQCEYYQGEDCVNCSGDCGICSLQDWHIGLIVGAALLVISLVVGAFCYFEYKQRKMIWDESWILKYEDLNTDYPLSQCAKNDSTASLYSGVTGDTCIHKMYAFTCKGTLNGAPVAVKHIPKINFEVTDEVRKEVKAVRELNHENICRFKGACVSDPGRVAIVMEFWSRGNLHDILMNKYITLPWDVRMYFANGVARGMSHLHKAKIIHGRLTTQNIVVDDTWTVKITDYGLPILRAERMEKRNEEIELIRFQNYRMYMSPKMMSKDMTFSVMKLTPEMDVYNYSVVLLQIGIRDDLYGGRDPQMLASYWIPYNLRKMYEETMGCPYPAAWNRLLELCRAGNPNIRPEFWEIVQMLHGIKPCISKFELLLKMSNAFENDLDDKVSDLRIERTRTDTLLYSMLPKSVARTLRKGDQVEPRWFEECTIYFSDIVGFTALVFSSKPQELVALLNKLYAEFDAAIEKHDIYKVETIGDAYMCVSGIPDFNERHACEIADMALSIVKVIEDFEIPHREDERLKIRIGIHSGRVCAGVVGIQLPKYCLFGNTVNLASRMESTGEACKIHLSHSCYYFLEAAGGYLVEPREGFTLKGRPDMKTYWLKGHEDERINLEV